MPAIHQLEGTAESADSASREEDPLSGAGVCRQSGSNQAARPSPGWLPASFIASRRLKVVSAARVLLKVVHSAAPKGLFRSTLEPKRVLGGGVSRGSYAGRQRRRQPLDFFRVQAAFRLA